MKIPRVGQLIKEPMFNRYIFKKHGVTVTQVRSEKDRIGLYFSLDGGKIFFIDHKKNLKMSYGLLRKIYLALNGRVHY